MYIETVKSKRGGKVYQQVLLRESYREPGVARSAVKKRTLLNLTQYPKEVVDAIALALKHKGDLAVLRSIKDIGLVQGPSVGATWAIYRVARSLGIDKALGSDHQGKLALWQVIARVIDQGSRLSSVRLAQALSGPDSTFGIHVSKQIIIITISYDRYQIISSCQER